MHLPICHHFYVNYRLVCFGYISIPLVQTSCQNSSRRVYPNFVEGGGRLLCARRVYRILIEWGYLVRIMLVVAENRTPGPLPGRGGY